MGCSEGAFGLTGRVEPRTDFLKKCIRKKVPAFEANEIGFKSRNLLFKSSAS